MLNNFLERFILVLAVTVALLGCGRRGDVYFADARKEVMTEFAAQLSESKVPYEWSGEQIHVLAAYVETARQIKAKIDTLALRAREVSWPCQELTSAFKAALSSRKMRFTVTTHNGSEWIRWYPASEEEDRKVSVDAVNSFRKSADDEAKLRCHLETVN